jgi:hypothetical protein
MGSIAADNSGNMAIGYSTSNGTAPNFPSIAYAGRLVTDPLNQLPQTETQLVAGGGSQLNNCGGGPCHRWGDYSSMGIDPADDCTFWYAQEYYDTQASGTTGNWHTRIGSFKFPSCVALAPSLAADAKTLVNESCPPANNAIDPGERATVNLALINNGTVATTNLVATLQPNGNVLAPSGPQNYGGIAPTGTAGRDFTFTAAGNCGDVITLTLSLQDGARNLGTASYNFTLGCNTACAGAPRISTSATLACDGGNTVATITVSNSGTATADNVVLTTAKIGAVNGTVLPQNIGSLAPGASSVRTVTFSGAPSGSQTLQVGGTFTGGTYNSSRKTTAPACSIGTLSPATPLLPVLSARLAVFLLSQL